MSYDGDKIQYNKIQYNKVQYNKIQTIRYSTRYSTI